MNYSRRDRRRLAKQFGLIKSDETNSQATERRSRSKEAGDQINMQFLAENEVRLREAAADREAAQLESLTASVGADEAARIMVNNKKIQAAREAKQASKNAKRSA